MKFYALFGSEQKVVDDILSSWGEVWDIHTSREALQSSIWRCLNMNKENGVVSPSAYVYEVEFIEPDLGQLVICAFVGSSWLKAKGKVLRVDKISLENLRS